MYSTMFLSDLTVIDHAYIDSQGKLVGGSFNPSFLVRGPIDEVESVVVDFSSIKKSMKALIDDKYRGLDHKLWITSASNCIVENGERVSISSDYVLLNLPETNIARIDNEYSIDGVSNSICDMLQQEFTQLQFTCNNKVNPHLIDSNYPFRYFKYSHSLKDSTSWGCQGVHGHLSWFQLFTGPRWSEKHPVNFSLLDLIQKELDNTNFIFEENIRSIDGKHIHTEYDTRDRGVIRASYSRSLKNVILQTETTIEYLVEFVVNLFYKDLKSNNVQAIALSEGLTKGAFLEL